MLAKLRRLLLVSFTGLILTAQASYNLPQLGQPGYDGLTPVQEDAIGLQFYAYVLQTLPIDDDPLLNQYIQTLGAQLVRYSDKPQGHFVFLVVRDPNVNAFAGPGGYIAVNTGTITTARSEGELAAVISHEIAHVTQRHIARSIASMKKMQAANVAAILAAIALGSHGGSGLAAAAAAGSTQQMINFTRSNEQEADRVGMQTLARAGYPPIDMANFFSHLLKASSLNDLDKYPFLQTHPLTKERLAEAEMLSKNFVASHPRPQNPDFPYLQACALIDGNLVDYGMVRKLQAHAEESASHRYAYALSLMAVNKDDEALIQIDSLLKNQPNNRFFIITKANILSEQNKFSEAAAIVAPYYQKNPSDYATILEYADILLTQHKPHEAMRVLERYDDRYSTDINYLSMLAQAQGQAGNLGNAYLTRASIDELIGSNEAALTQLKQGLKLNKDPYMKGRLELEIANLESTITFQKSMN